jgi:hypothetical protein
MENIISVYTLKYFLDKIEEIFVNSFSQKGQYLAYLKIHGITMEFLYSCKIPLYNKTCWNF